MHNREGRNREVSVKTPDILGRRALSNRGEVCILISDESTAARFIRAVQPHNFSKAAHVSIGFACVYDARQRKL